MRRLCINSILVLISFQLAAQFNNIKLAEETDNQIFPMNPAIAIQNRDTKILVAGVGPNRAIFTHDGGGSWNEIVLNSPFGENGDPALIADAKGDFYYFHLSSSGSEGAKATGDRIVSQKSDDGGKTWSKGTSIGNNPPKNQRHASPAVHPKKQIIYLTWTEFDSYGLSDPSCQTNILFSMSTNAGGKWTDPVQVSQTPGDCINDDNTPTGSMPVIGLDGRIYSVWANQGIIFFDRSYDGGERWLTNDIGITKQYGGWSLTIPGVGPGNGRPTLAIDNSPSKRPGSLYVVYADQKNGEDDSDIWFVRSTSRGDSWTNAARINKDGPGKHQFMPAMAVDQVTGHIYVVYYDRRAYSDTQTDVYLAYSDNNGETFKEIIISESPFLPVMSKSQNYYINIAAHDGFITPIWTRMDDGKASVWTAVIKEESLPKK